jgi:flagellin-like protein
MNVKALFKNKKAVSSVIGAVIMIGVTISAVSIVYGILSSTMSFNSSIVPAGAISARDVDQDGLIDRMTVPLTNKGMANAAVESVVITQGENTYLWYTLDSSVRSGTMEELNIYALGVLQQIQPVQTFNIEIIFEDSVYTSPGYVVIDASEVPDEIIPIINDGESIPFTGYNKLVERTSEDDEYACKQFPAETGYSTNLWFLLGEFEDDNKRPDLNTDFISECDQGNEEEYLPYLLDNTEFTEGNIGSQSNYKITPYNDSGEHAGLIALNKYGRWDKQDTLNWGKYGVVYMWSYIYVPGDDDITVGFGANGASEFKVWLNGEHFAGQIVFFNSENTNADFGTLYNVWPALGDL